ncbi:hypothetical protein ES703_93022 [subsurface metagenome]
MFTERQVAVYNLPTRKKIFKVRVTGIDLIPIEMGYIVIRPRRRISITRARTIQCNPCPAATSRFNYLVTTHNTGSRRSVERPQFYQVNIGPPCAEGRRLACDYISAVRCLLNRRAPVISASPESLLPLAISIRIGLYEIYIPCHKGIGLACDYVSAVSCLLNRRASVPIGFPESVFPLDISIWVSLYKINVSRRWPERWMGIVIYACDYVSAVGCLPNRIARVIIWSTEGLLPEQVSCRIGLYKIHIGIPCVKGPSLACDYVSTIGSLLNRRSMVPTASPEGLFPLAISA